DFPDPAGRSGVVRKIKVAFIVYGNAPGRIQFSAGSRTVFISRSPCSGQHMRIALTIYAQYAVTRTLGEVYITDFVNHNILWFIKRDAVGQRQGTHLDIG